jgi:8-oxo-dGTP pyrophosphatase MutT (NUDIX family)
MTINCLKSIPSLNQIKSYVFPPRQEPKQVKQDVHSPVERKIPHDVRILHDNKYLQLREATVRYSDGKEEGYAYAHRPNGKDVGAIVPIVHEEDGDYIIFEEHERQAIKAEKGIDRCIELPSGTIGDTDKQETALDGLCRELKEETGYIADSMEIQTINCPSSSGLTSETFTIAIADINKPREEIKPNDRSIKGIYKVPLKDIFVWLKHQEEGTDGKDKKTVQSTTYTGLFFLLKRLIKEEKADKSNFDWNV